MCKEKGPCLSKETQKILVVSSAVHYNPLPTKSLVEWKKKLMMGTIALCLNPGYTPPLFSTVQVESF